MAGCIALLAMALTVGAPGEKASPQKVAVVVGVNLAAEPELGPLKFPDDDALAFATLFERLGIPTYVAARVDADTAALHRARLEGRRLFAPTREGVRQALAQARRDIAAALERGEERELIFAYAGHGSVKGGVGFITLEDGRLTGGDLERELVVKSGASRTHLIIDACYSVFLAYHRGPGGDRRPAAGFTQLQGLLQNPRVGMLLSTSATNLTHEWERFGAGVFGHLIRSGLYGAADADGDGRVTYRELGAFVEQATKSITNRRYRPSVFAKPPAASEALVHMPPDDDRLRVPPERSGRYLLEDDLGFRLADFHVAQSPVEVLRPTRVGRLFLREWETGKEYVIPKQQGLVDVAALSTKTRPLASRGSAEKAMEEIFLLPFSPQAVQAYRFADPKDLMHLEVPPDPIPTWRLVTGWGSIAMSVAAAAVGAAFTVSALDARDSLPHGASQALVFETNGRIAEHNLRSGIMFGVSGAALATGLGLLLWPSAPPQTGIETGIE